MDAEIMQILLEEAKEGYDEEIVVELYSEVAEDVEQNVERVEQWIETWKKANNEEGA